MAGWSYQWITQLGWADNPRTAPTDVRRIPPQADATTVTATQIRDLVGRLGHTDVTPPFVFDAGYDAPALTGLLSGVATNLVVRGAMF